MGSCLSKKSICASSNPIKLPEKINVDETQFEKKKPVEEPQVKKEIFIIKHHKSHEIEKLEGEFKNVAEKTPESDNIFKTNGAIRTSSCTKEELDAILIQCGRLSRSSSAERKYSGSKRSYDFDNDKKSVDGEDDAVSKERDERHRQKSQGRRRTPSRERDREQRSGSRERHGRRVSRSPGRRSDSPSKSGGANSSTSSANAKPGKLVSVPATDKGSNGSVAEANSAVGVKRIQVKRNVGSPRARSPAQIRENNQNVSSAQNPVLSRSSSRKAEVSPFRRNPLGEIDTNIISQAPIQKQNADTKITKLDEKKLNTIKLESKTKEQQLAPEETKEPNHHVGLNVISSGPENLKEPITLTRTRSSRLSRDLDNILTPENPNSTSYTALLLEDIQNFHQKKTTTTTTTPFTVPPCLTKANSILEAVADLNSSTGSNFSRNPVTEQLSKMSNNNKSASFVESEIVAEDDLMEPSFHKYVTVRRGTMDGDELGEEESSGSNSFVGSHLVSSSWEPNSADSTDRWTSSSSSRSKGVGSSGKRRDLDNQVKGIGRGRVGLKSAVAAST